MTVDQLIYILERKFHNIRNQIDFIVACHTSHTRINDIFEQIIGDAYILEWRIDYIPQPNTEEISNWWKVLEEQYNSDPTRPDSNMVKYLNSRKANNPPVVINSSI
jgi:hypothetical protein